MTVPSGRIPKMRSPAFFAGVTRIKVVSHGAVLIDEAVDTRRQPWSVPGGVSFDVAESE